MKNSSITIPADSSPVVLTSAQQKSVTDPGTSRSMRWLKRRLERLLVRLHSGSLQVCWPDGELAVYGDTDGELAASIELRHWRALRRLFLQGQIGFAEGYIEGDWHSPDLLSLFELIVRNETTFSSVQRGRFLSGVLNWLQHATRRNSKRGSRRNIAYHYDLGNAFYRLWLDDSLLYSAAIYEQESDTLEQAQARKLQRIGDWLAPTAGSRVLEIGCGWGRLAEYLANRFAVHVDGVSLSRQQLAIADAQRRIQPARADTGSTAFHFRDYRDIEGRFDRIVSIEMFEAVGREYWRTYFSTLAERLTDQGVAVLQVITIDEARFERYARQPDFIQRHVFPGGMLPTKTHLAELAQAAGFDIEDTFWFGQGYARTLSDWRARFIDALDAVRQQGYDERFLRLWRYYLDYCEAGFRLETTDVGLLRLRKSRGQCEVQAVGQTA